MNTKSLIASMAVSMAMAGNVSASELATMEGIPAEVMSHSELDKVEGKNFSFYPLSFGYGSWGTVNQSMAMNGVWQIPQLIRGLQGSYPNLVNLAINPAGYVQQFNPYLSPSQANAAIASFDSQYGSLFALGNALSGGRYW